MTIDTSLSLTSAASSIIYGQTVQLIATITAADDSTPAGTITFKDGTTTLGTGTLAVSSGNDQATLCIGNFTAGSHTHLVAVFSADATYNGSTSSEYTQTVNPKALTIGGVNAVDKAYNGTTAATLDATSATLSGVIGADDVSLVASGASGAFANKNAGDDKTVTATGFTLSGSAASNYSLTQPTGLSADITVRTLTVSAAACNKGYDGTVAATVTLSDDRVSGDVFTDSDSSAAFADKNAGTAKTVTVTGIGISGTDAPNYALASTTATTTANINARSLTISAAGQDKTYDGTTTATVTLSDNRVSGDVFSDSYTSAIFNDKNVDTGKPVSVGGITISGGDAGNYSFNTTASTTATISALAVTGSITVDNKVYTGTTAATIASRSLAGVISGDTVSYVGGSAAFDTKDVGTSKTVTATGLGLSGPDAGNYTVNSTAMTTADITAHSLAITANNQSKPFGATLTFAGTEFSPVGLQNGETIGSVTLASSGASSGAAVGTYDITISNATGGTFATSNYSISYSTGTLTVNKATTGTDLTSDANPSVFGETVTFTATVGVLTGAGQPTGTVAFKKDGTTVATKDINEDGVATYSVGSLAVGDYDYVAAYSGDGSFLTSTSSPVYTQSVRKASVTTLVSAHPNPSTYGDLVTFTAEVTAVSPGSGVPSGSVDFKMGDVILDSEELDEDGIATFATTALGAGVDNIVAVYSGSGSFLNSTSDSYAQTVNKADQTITWSDPADITYGTALSGTQLDAVVSVPGPSAHGTVSYTPAAGTVLNVGDHQTLTVNVAATANYNAATKNVYIDVNPASLLITANNQTKTYGQTFTFAGTEFTPTGLTNGDTVTSVTLTSAGGAATAIVGNSPYDIVASSAQGSGLTNYTISYGVGQLTVTKRLATWTTNAASKTYGDADPSPLTTGSGSNFVDTVTASYNRAAGETVAGGPYHITATLSAASGVLDNYTITNNGADFTINKR
jgi:hypothetical protein